MKKSRTIARDLTFRDWTRSAAWRPAAAAQGWEEVKAVLHKE